MKQICLKLLPLCMSICIIQVQGGIITNQQSLTLPAELIADSVASSSISSSATSTSTSNNLPGKNETRTGRVIYTAAYSNVRISSKEPKDSLKNLKYFPQVMSKKPTPVPAKIVPVLPTSTSTSTTTSTTSTTTTPEPTTSTSTTPVPPPPSTSEEPELTAEDFFKIVKDIESESNGDRDQGMEVDVDEDQDDLQNEAIAIGPLDVTETVLGEGEIASNEEQGNFHPGIGVTEQATTAEVEEE